MPNILDALRDSAIQYKDSVVSRISHPADTLAQALRNLVQAPPEDIATSLIGGGVGHISSAAMKKMFPELAKTVMKEGETLIPLYHGTSKDKDFTKLKDSPRGIFLTKDPKGASSYAIENDSRNFKYNPDIRKYEEVNTAARVIPVYADIRNPYIIQGEEAKQYAMSENYGKVQKEIMAKARAAGHDAVIYPDGGIAVATSAQIKSSLSPK